MSICKWDVCWSNSNHDNFIMCGTSVTQYRVENNANLGHNQMVKAVPLSPTTRAIPLYTCLSSDVQFMKCVALYPRPDYPNLLAIGQVIGKILLTNLGDARNCDLAGKEFAQRHTRQCNYLAWNPIESNLLAAGFEKNRHDGCIAIWDVNSKCAESSMSLERKHYVANEVTKPYLDIGISEFSTSFCWQPMESKTFVAGVNKCLRVYDIRESTKPQLSTSTKALYGISIDPLFPNRVVSFTENQVFIWNLRNLDDPEFTISELKPVQKVSWCPTRVGFLSILCKDSSTIQHCDIIHTSDGPDLEPAYIQRYTACDKSWCLSSFAWHLSEDNRFLTIRPNGVITDEKICNQIALDWSNEFNLTKVSGKQKDDIHLNKDLHEEDIGIVMKNRAMLGYGMEIDKPWKSAEIVQDDKVLSRLWTWMALCKDRSKDKVRKGDQSCFYGVESVLVALRSKETRERWQGLEDGETCAKYVYRSDERYHVLQMCGWDNLQKPTGIAEFRKRLQKRGEYERAAAIALFNLHITLALAILNDERSPSSDEESDRSLALVGMALAGFTENKDALWQKMCRNFRRQLTSPYLRAMFWFLSSSETDNYKEILFEDGIAVGDRVAFACTFLPDDSLMEYIQSLSNQLVLTANLDGILLTGLSDKGVQLLQKYVDATSDLQTACFIAISTFPSWLSTDARADSWIHGYRNLLNQWKLWQERAMFDILWQGCDSQSHDHSEVFVSCNSCRKCVSRSGQNLVRNRQQQQQQQQNNWTRSSNTAKHVKVSCCPHCGNPLPRCALCLKNLGTASGALSIEGSPDCKTSPFKNWFTWCQSCRHGGHASHITDWFKDHFECPVAGCYCKCMALD
ncbi:complex MIOS [Argonauta hians]